jgi:hypothetical protein
MSPRRVAAVTAAFVAAATVVCAAAQGRPQDVTRLRAVLGARQEIPRQVVPTPAATGRFTATLTDISETQRRLVWRLTFAHLSGAALAAHIHRGARGVSGPIVIPLCGPCRSGAHGSIVVRDPLASALDEGGMYVNVHTKTNPAGEIRGQLVKVEGD